MQAKFPDPTTLLPLGHLDFQILTSLGQRDAHGYAIARDIEERTGGIMAPGMSSLYLVIRRLSRSGLVVDGGDRRDEESGGPPRRYYRITKLGRRVARLETLRLREQAKLASRIFLEAQ